MEPDGTMSTREAEVGEELWNEGTQVRVFYGPTPQEKASHSKWKHRKPRMWNVQKLPDATTTGWTQKDSKGSKANSGAYHTRPEQHCVL